MHHPEQIRRGGRGLPRRILVAADLTAEDQDAVAVATLAAATRTGGLLSDHHIRRVLHHAAVPVLVVPVQP